MTTSRTETLTAADGGRFSGHLVCPDSGSGPGLVVIQEVFGVNDYIRDVCERFAGLGYVTLAPDMFWRLEPGIELPPTDEGLTEAIGYANRFDWTTGIADAFASLEHLGALDETIGDPGIAGMCFGGTVAFRAAAVGDPAVCVSYYGSGVPDALDEGTAITCPTLVHFGRLDPFMPEGGMAAVAAWARDRANIDVVFHDAGHAFDNHTNPAFSNPSAAAEAWDVTAGFLATHLPT